VTDLTTSDLTTYAHRRSTVSVIDLRGGKGIGDALEGARDRWVSLAPLPFKNLADDNMYLFPSDSAKLTRLRPAPFRRGKARQRLAAL
jgi:hypothetical protein